MLYAIKALNYIYRRASMFRYPSESEIRSRIAAEQRKFLFDLRNQARKTEQDLRNALRRQVRKIEIQSRG